MRHGPPHIRVRDWSRPDKSVGSPDRIVRSPQHEFNGHDCVGLERVTTRREWQLRGGSQPRWALDSLAR